ncbi:MAG: MarC family protein [Bacteriovoracia bacterium]
MTADYILTVFITLITVVDPLGLIPVYLPIAERFEKQRRKYIVWYSVGTAMIITTIFLFMGKYLFRYLHIDYNAIYIVGGILLFMIGLDMIYARPRRTKSSPEEQEEAQTQSLQDVSVFPLAIPMLAGPGTIATVIMFSSRRDELINYVVVLGAALISLLICAVVMIFSEKLLKIFGRTGINVLDRVMGIILCALAVQFLINAVTSLVKSMS